MKFIFFVLFRKCPMALIKIVLVLFSMQSSVNLKPWCTLQCHCLDIVMYGSVVLRTNADSRRGVLELFQRGKGGWGLGFNVRLLCPHFLDGSP